MKLKKIAEQVVVVVGASSGLGRATALKFAEHGARVVVAARGEHGLETLVQEIGSDRALACVADVCDPEQMRLLAETAQRHFGRIDTWVHNAGIYFVAPFESIRPEEFRRVIEVDLLGCAYSVMAALPQLRRSNGGSLICVTSVEGRCAFPLHAPYAAAKHGVIGMLDALRVELLNEKVPISVTNIMPGAIDTPLFSNGRSKIGVRPGAPCTIYEPDLVADAILYAAEHPVRDLVVGGSGVFYSTARQLAPALSDYLMLGSIPQQLSSNEERNDSSIDNWYTSVDDYRIHGDYHQQAKSWSLPTWLRMHPTPTAVVAIAVGLTGLILGLRKLT